MSGELIIDHACATSRVPLTPSAQDKPLSAVLAEAGMPLNTRCGGRGWCSGCEVDLVEGRVTGRDGPVEAPARVRACSVQADPAETLHFSIPQRSHLAHAPHVEDNFSINVPFDIDPPFAVERGRADTGFAVDIGTTTVAVVLVDLGNGTVLSRAGAYNAQIRYGDNVLTRIGAAGTGHLEHLRRAMVHETLAPLLVKACQRAGRGPERLCGGTVAGNSTMLHLLLGVDPSSMGTAPFTPVFLDSRTVTAGELGLCAEPGFSRLAPQLPVILLPGFSAYVGADLAAGAHATGMAFDEQPSVLVDIGTNGEMLLHSDGRLLGCATAAGPAFEGAGLLSGTRAHAGAISHVYLGSNPFSVRMETIGKRDPAGSPGLCGTAYVDFLAEARRVGLLQTSGRFDRNFLKMLPKELLVETPHGPALWLVDDLCVGELDVSNLLQAKAAIAAGLGILLEQAGMSPERISRLYVAGGFGMHITIENALAVGFFPGFRREQIQVVGNTSLAGALLAALDRNALPRMNALRATARMVELNQHPEFEDRFIDALMLP
jgi:uncharacterized 2Fe-2S/4Fe-4S cluster protein (DUF4445 family)